MMKKILFLFTIMPLALIIIFSGRLSSKSYYGALVALSAFFIIFVSYFYFEKSKKGIKDIAVIATIGSFAAVSRVPFVIIPNVQPVTFIVVLAGSVFGSYTGFLIGTISAFVSNIFLGQGPWTPWQMIAWGTAGAIGGIFSKKKLPVEAFSILCFAAGFIYGFIMNLWCVLGFVKTINFTSIALTYINAVPFDLAHAIGNFLFTIVFYDKFYNILARFYRKVNYIEK